MDGSNEVTIAIQIAFVLCGKRIFVKKIKGQCHKYQEYEMFPTNFSNRRLSRNEEKNEFWAAKMMSAVPMTGASADNPGKIVDSE